MLSPAFGRSVGLSVCLSVCLISTLLSGYTACMPSFLSESNGSLQDLGTWSYITASSVPTVPIVQGKEHK